MDQVRNSPYIETCQQPQVCPQAQPMVVDFNVASSRQNQIAQLEKILEITKAKRSELQAAYQQETGNYALPFSAGVISNIPVYKADPNKSYAQLMHEMATEAAVRKQGARSDAKNILELQEQIRKEQAISSYLENLRHQIQPPKQNVGADRARLSERSAGSSEPSLLDTAAKIAFCAIALNVIPSHGISSGLSMGALTFGLIKIIGNALENVSFVFPHYQHA